MIQLRKMAEDRLNFESLFNSLGSCIEVFGTPCIYILRNENQVFAIF